MATREPCTACSWTSERQSYCDYKSHLCLFYEASRRGVWSLGSQYILKDRESTPPDYEPQNTRFLQKMTTIPVPSTVLEWSEPDDTSLRIVKRMEGIPLTKAWPNLQEDEKRNIAKQTCEYLAQLRTLQSDWIEGLDHKPIYDSFLFSGPDNTPYGPLKSDDELWDAMAGNIKQLPSKVQQVLRQNMPPATPYTFTHGDLSQANILVKDGQVTGIIDWEVSGYLPRWWEFVKTLMAQSKEDAEWKALLREYMEFHGNGARFWQICNSLREYPDLSETGKETLAAIERESESENQ